MIACVATNVRLADDGSIVPKSSGVAEICSARPDRFSKRRTQSPNLTTSGDIGAC